MKPRRTGRLVGLALAISGSLMLTAPAHADSETMIAADFDYAHSAGSGIGSGWGFGARFGQRFHVPLVAFDPELAFTYHGFSDQFSPKMYRGIAGLRVGFLEIVRPGVYGHLGVGHADFDLADASHTAFTYDFGVFLDFTPIPVLDLGLHAGYDGIAGGDNADAINWVTAGIHAALLF